MTKQKEDSALARFTEICLALPETTRALAGKHAELITRKKKLAYWLDDHHGDGIVGFTVRVAPGKNARLIESEPKRYFMPAYIGARGWVGYRLDVPGIDWEKVADLVIESWRALVPKKLADDASATDAAKRVARAHAKARPVVAKITKAAPAVEDALERVRKIALAFPRAEEKLSHGAPSFHVKGKMFLTFVDDHHGDGKLAAWCKATFEEQKRLVATDANRFYVPPYVGVKGWVGVRLDLPATDWIELAIIVEEGWRSVAPRSIAG